MAKSRRSEERKALAVDRRADQTAGDAEVAVVLCAAIIVLVGIVAYYNSLRGVFVFDDYPHIVDNQAIESFAPLSTHLGARRPLVSLSLAFNYAIGGLNPQSFHVFNIAVHLLAGLTLFGIVRLTARIVFGRDAPAASTFMPAVIAGLIWVAHPMQTQSVTYIIQRGESMMGLFYLLTLYCTIRGSQSRTSTAWYAASIVFCVCGMGSKAVMVTAPLVVLLYDRTFLSASIAEAIRRRWPLYLGLAASWSILVATGVVGGVLSTDAGEKATVGFSYKDVTPLHYLLTQPSVILFYIKQAVFPSQICLDYGWPATQSALSAAIPGLSVLFLLGLTAWACLRRRWWGFVGAWFFLILAPTSSLIPIRDIAFIHRMYLPLAALAICAAWGLLWISRRFAPRLGISRTAACVSILVPLIGAEIACTWSRNRVYANKAAIWADVVEKRPRHARAWVNLGEAISAEQRTQDAIRCYQTAIALAPNKHILCAAYTNLGSAYGLLHQYAEAKDALQKAIEINDKEWPILANFAKVLDRLGEKKQALAIYAKVVEIDGGNSIARVRSARILGQLGHYEEAVEMGRQAAALAPTDAGIWYNMGNSLARLGRLTEAIDAYRHALKINPGDPNARCNLGDMLMRLDRAGEAVGELERAVRFSPQHIPSNYCLGLALQKQGRLSEAAKAFSRVLQLDPNHAQAAAALAQLRTKAPGV